MTEIVPAVCSLAQPNIGFHCWAYVSWDRSWYCTKCGCIISDEQMRYVDGPENAAKLDAKSIEVWETFRRMA